eukprot:CAMPEP_0114547398 /NCGR_PEP_ID=MMETSP0114-20121206/4444_1 /TAXON_ID=31324 /ORGANISM="Goniomonas sp, Strain m" /LENGTH=119 /DNA_ID=CAMNT_0001731953 /DNA_START=181 /DNA_END=538 /DNA_ORIENTATION=-
MPPSNVQRKSSSTAPIVHNVTVRNVATTITAAVAMAEVEQSVVKRTKQNMTAQAALPPMTTKNLRKHDLRTSPAAPRTILSTRFRRNSTKGCLRIYAVIRNSAPMTGAVADELWARCAG